MRIWTVVAMCGLVAGAVPGFGQTEPAHGAVAARAAGAGTSAPAQLPADAANAGRKQLSDFLDGLAAGRTAARRRDVAAIQTRAAAEARQRLVRATILRLLGALPERTPLNARITGTTVMDGFRVDKVLFDSQPDFPVTALLYVPAAVDPGAVGSAKFPAIVMAPGHSAAGKAGDVAMATAFAKAGFVVLSYDPIGQGERLQYPDPANPGHTLSKAPTGEHGEAGLQPTLIGDAVAQYFLWDGMRAVDYLQTRAEVDPKRIGAFGCSGGGAMTALLGALDARVAAVGTACYWTSYDALLPSIGPQDAEQSIPGFVAAGLDFPDWVELAAPRPYAMIATTSDMFPFAGAQTTEAEARRFYGLLGAEDRLQFVTGPGGHGNLRPILPQILRFFVGALRPDPAYAKNLPPVTDPFDVKANPPRGAGERPAFPPPPPASLAQVTPSGQVATSFPGAATVFSLNKARADRIETPHPRTLAELQAAVREVTHARAVAGDCKYAEDGASALCQSGGKELHVSLGKPDFVHAGDTEMPLQRVRFAYSAEDGFYGFLANHERKHPRGGLLLLSEEFGPDGAPSAALRQRVIDLAKRGKVVLAVCPRPSPAGTEETKSPLLGPFYLTELRAELVGRTLLGLRTDDALAATSLLTASLLPEAQLPHGSPFRLDAEASGHLGLVLLHAAVLDNRLQHVTVSGALASYRDLVNNPLPKDAPQDILPGVLRRYDLADVRRLLGPRAVNISAP